MSVFSSRVGLVIKVTYSVNSLRKLDHKPFKLASSLANRGTVKPFLKFGTVAVK